MRGFLMHLYGFTFGETTERGISHLKDHVSTTYLIDLFDIATKYGMPIHADAAVQILKGQTKQSIELGVSYREWCWCLAVRIYNDAGDRDYTTLRQLVVEMIGSQADRLAEV
jgi:hypothetical protein